MGTAPGTDDPPAPTCVAGHFLVIRHQAVVQLLIHNLGGSILAGFCEAACMAPVPVVSKVVPHIVEPPECCPPWHWAHVRCARTARAARARHSSVPRTTHSTVSADTLLGAAAAAMGTALWVRAVGQ